MINEINFSTNALFKAVNYDADAIVGI